MIMTMLDRARKTVTLREHMPQLAERLRGMSFLTGDGRSPLEYQLNDGVSARDMLSELGADAASEPSDDDAPDTAEAKLDLRNAMQTLGRTQLTLADLRLAEELPKKFSSIGLSLVSELIPADFGKTDFPPAEDPVMVHKDQLVALRLQAFSCVSNWRPSLHINRILEEVDKLPDRPAYTEHLAYALACAAVQLISVPSNLPTVDRILRRILSLRGFAELKLVTPVFIAFYVRVRGNLFPAYGPAQAVSDIGPQKAALLNALSLVPRLPDPALGALLTTYLKVRTRLDELDLKFLESVRQDELPDVPAFRSLWEMTLIEIRSGTHGPDAPIRTLEDMEELARKIPSAEEGMNPAIPPGVFSETLAPIGRILGELYPDQGARLIGLAAALVGKGVRRECLRLIIGPFLSFWPAEGQGCIMDASASGLLGDGPLMLHALGEAAMVPSENAWRLAKFMEASAAIEKNSRGTPERPATLCQRLAHALVELENAARTEKDPAWAFWRLNGLFQERLSGEELWMFGYVFAVGLVAAAWGPAGRGSEASGGRTGPGDGLLRLLRLIPLALARDPRFVQEILAWAACVAMAGTAEIPLPNPGVRRLQEAVTSETAGLSDSGALATALADDLSGLSGHPQIAGAMAIWLGCCVARKLPATVEELMPLLRPAMKCLRGGLRREIRSGLFQAICIAMTALDLPAETRGFVQEFQHFLDARLPSDDGYGGTPRVPALDVTYGVPSQLAPHLSKLYHVLDTGPRVPSEEEVAKLPAGTDAEEPAAGGSCGAPSGGMDDAPS
jgi:hypothetical protein